MDVMLLTGLVVGFLGGVVTGVIGLIAFALLEGDATLSREGR